MAREPCHTGSTQVRPPVRAHNGCVSSGHPATAQLRDAHPNAGPHSLSYFGSFEAFGISEWLIVEGPTRRAWNPVRADIAEFFFEGLIDIVERPAGDGVPV